MDWLRIWRGDRYLHKSRYSDALLALPPGLQGAWAGHAAGEFPGIPTDAFFFVRAAEGLLCFFDAVARSGRQCALPSLAADSVWHAWQRHDPAGLIDFCRRRFGAAIPHLESGRLEPGALARTLVACRRMEAIPPGGPALPQLFTLDTRLRMPRGRLHLPLPDGVAWAELGPTGRRLGQLRPHAELSAAALFAAGLIEAQAYEDAQRRQRESGEAAAVTGADGEGGAHCADGGGDGGAGGCGGGCGGGGGD